MKDWLKDRWLPSLAIILIAGAFGTFPYAYYQLMNWVVVAAALVTAWQAHRQKKNAVMWLFLLLAVVFNPVAPFQLRQSDWQIADVTAAILFLLSFFVVRGR